METQCKLMLHVFQVVRCSSVWVLPFISNRNLKKNVVGELSCAELHQAEHFMIWGIQCTAFQEEIELLESGQCVSCGNVLSPLCSYLNDKAYLRVGGCLRKILLPGDAKHQLILPKSHPVTGAQTIAEQRELVPRPSD